MGLMAPGKCMSEADRKAIADAQTAKAVEIDKAVMAAKYGTATDEQIKLAVGWLVERYHSDAMARSLSNDPRW